MSIQVQATHKQCDFALPLLENSFFEATLIFLTSYSNDRLLRFTALQSITFENICSVYLNTSYILV